MSRAPGMSAGSPYRLDLSCSRRVWCKALCWTARILSGSAVVCASQAEVAAANGSGRKTQCSRDTLPSLTPTKLSRPVDGALQTMRCQQDGSPLSNGSAHLCAPHELAASLHCPLPSMPLDLHVNTGVQDNITGRWQGSPNWRRRAPSHCRSTRQDRWHRRRGRLDTATACFSNAAPYSHFIALQQHMWQRGRAGLQPSPCARPAHLADRRNAREDIVHLRRKVDNTRATLNWQNIRSMTMPPWCT